MEDHIGYTLALLVGEEIKKEDEGLDLKLESPRLQCHVCYKIMGHRSSLYKHLKYIHKIEPAHRLPITCREKDCYQSFTFIDPFRRHLAEHHGFNIVVEKYVFQSMSEFFGWKKMTEQQENLRFIVSTGPRNSKGGKTHYFRCQKNGIYKPEIKKRLQADDRDSVYNVSRTHCISSMFVFEEPKCVTVEFCRTHYGHDSNSEKYKSPKSIADQEADSTSMETENHLNYETIDSLTKLNSYLSEKDKGALLTILNENRHLLEETEELFYENEQDVMLKIPYNMLNKILKDGIKEEGDESDPEAATISTTAEGDCSGNELNPEKTDDEEEGDPNDSTILKSLGNGIFLDPTSNKRLRLDSLKNKKRTKEKNHSMSDPESEYVSSVPSQYEPRKKMREKNTMLVKEYLNEFDEKVYVLEPVSEEDTVVRRRERILSQLQTILMMVNSEEDEDVLEDVEKYLSKFVAS